MGGVLTTMLTMALLPTYAETEAAEWSLNPRFPTKLYATAGEPSFCSMEAVVGSTDTGIEYRISIAFGARNELRLATETPLDASQLSLVIPGGGSYDFQELKQIRVGMSHVLVAAVPWATMGKILFGLKQAEAAELQIKLKHGTASSTLPITKGDETLKAAAVCEDRRLGEVPAN